MPLGKFSIIACLDLNGGIGRNGTIPWTNKVDMDYFRKKTRSATHTNIVIMGRKTYQSFPRFRFDHYGGLDGRLNVIVSTTLSSENNPPNIIVTKSLKDALVYSMNVQQDTSCSIFICGGREIYKEALEKYLHLCDNIFLSRLNESYDCDVFFPSIYLQSQEKASNVQDHQIVVKINDIKTEHHDESLVIHRYSVQHDHWEYQYLNFLKRLLIEGKERGDRTGVGTISLFGEKLSFDISKDIPLLTTKQLYPKQILKELLFFVSGKTNTKLLEEQGINIWKGNTSKSFLEQRGLSYEEGDMGPMYGHQLRHWGTEYQGMNGDYEGKGIDQLSQVVESIKTDPFSRRHIINMWNVADLDKMVLAPCHCFVQFYVSSDKKYLDSLLYQRSGDYFLGVPWNIFSYATLTYMIAHLCGLKPRTFTHVFGDVHIYSNHLDVVQEQIKRVPLSSPKLRFKNVEEIKTIDDFKLENFEIIDYDSYPPLKAPMAV